MALDNPRAGFSFGLPTIANTPGQTARLAIPAAPMQNLRVKEEYNGMQALLFDVGGPAFGDNGDPLWIDANSGHVLGVEWGIPAHAGMEDFAIHLADINDGGDPAWQALLAQHCEGCLPPDANCNPAMTVLALRYDPIYSHGAGRLPCRIDCLRHARGIF